MENINKLIELYKNIVIVNMRSFPNKPYQFIDENFEYALNILIDIGDIMPINDQLNIIEKHIKNNSIACGYYNVQIKDQLGNLIHQLHYKNYPCNCV